MSSTETRETFAYELSLISVNHSNNYWPEHDIIGVWSSKDGAVSAAGNIDTEYGTFDSAIDSMFADNHVDKRSNPPDNGILLQIGNRSVGEGDLVQLRIKKVVIDSPATNTEPAVARASSEREEDARKEFVYVLSLTSDDHSNGCQPEHRVAGVYSSKAAAAFAAGSVDTNYGTLKIEKFPVESATSSTTEQATARASSTAESEGSSPKSKKSKACISIPNASKRQKVEPKEASLMVIMKDIMKPAEYTRRNRKIQRMAKTMESEAARLRNCREHKFGINVEPENLFEVHSGDFWGMIETRNYMRAHVALANVIYEEIASVYDTPVAWERALWHYQEMLRLSSSDNLGIRYCFPLLLLRLNRDDDAFCFIRYWVKDPDEDGSNDDAYSAREKLHHTSNEGDWLYGHEKDCRYLDIFLLVSAEKFKYGGLAFLVALACIKMRIIAEEHSSKAEQRIQLNRIISLIDGLNPTMLPALLHPEPLLSQPQPEDMSNGSPSECYSIVKDASPIWHAIPGALKVLQDRCGEKPSYDCDMRIPGVSFYR